MSRRPWGRPGLLWLALAAATFVLVDLGLFGWLIFRSLSQREVERVLLEARREAHEVAEELAERAAAQGEDLYQAMALERETETYIDEILSQRDVVETVEVRDRAGRLVLRADSEITFYIGDEQQPRLESREMPTELRRETFEREAAYDVEVPIGEVGFLQVGISRAELEGRIGLLRRDLLAQTTVIGVVTALLAALGYVLIRILWVRGRRLEEQAREAEQMAYVGTLASGLAHEIRNPLNALNLNMQLLEEEIGSASDRRLFSITREEIVRLDRMVSSFLSYARPKPLEKVPQAAVTVLDALRAMMASEIEGEGVELVVDDQASGAWVAVDEEQIRQLLLNLVRNAVASIHDVDRTGRVILRVRRAGGRVVFEVEDNGEGIPAKQQGKIFDVFYSTRKGGTGLGLAVVRTIARAHDAQLQVESAPGEGTTVRLTLPAAEPPKRHAGAEPSLAAS